MDSLQRRTASRVHGKVVKMREGQHLWYHICMCVYVYVCNVCNVMYVMQGKVR